MTRQAGTRLLTSLIVQEHGKKILNCNYHVAIQRGGETLDRFQGEEVQAQQVRRSTRLSSRHGLIFTIKSV